MPASDLIKKNTSSGGGEPPATKWLEEIFDNAAGATVNLVGTLPANSAEVVVLLNGSELSYGAGRDYTYSGSIITFNWALLQDRVKVRYRKPV